MKGRPDLYDLRRWRRRSQRQLQAHPMCSGLCEREGRTTAAVLAHHVVPHNGDKRLFFFGELQSLCFACHLIEHGRSPKRDYEPTIGDDGWPVDVAHPVYKTDAARRETQS